METRTTIAALVSMLAVAAFATPGCVAAPPERDGEAGAAGQDEAAGAAEDVGEAAGAALTCAPKTTCGAGKVCGAWTGFTDCGTVCSQSEDCWTPGRTGHAGPMTTFYKQRSRSCNMPNGTVCTEVQYSYSYDCGCVP